MSEKVNEVLKDLSVRLANLEYQMKDVERTAKQFKCSHCFCRNHYGSYGIKLWRECCHCEKRK